MLNHTHQQVESWVHEEQKPDIKEITKDRPDYDLQEIFTNFAFNK